MHGDMSLVDCLIAAKVTYKGLLALAKKYEKNPVKLIKRISEVSEAAQIQKTQAMLQMKAQKSIEVILDKFDTPKKRSNAIMDMMSMAGIRGKVGMSLERKIDGVLSPVHRELADMMEAYRPKKLGFSASKSGQRKMIRAIFDPEGVVDPDALQYAKSWKKVTEMLRKRFGAASGRQISKLEDWNIPQSHDPIKLAGSTFEDWYGFVKSRLDLDRILPEVSEVTGEFIIDHDDIVRKVLKSVYDNLKSDGYSKIDTTALKPFLKRKIGNRHQDHRLLHFKDADSWLQYSDKFGGPDYYNTMMGYTELMSREIAAMEMFGPNPDAVVDVLVKSVKGRSGELISNTYKELMGRNFGFNNKLAHVSQSLRNLEVGFKLGFAMIPALSDTFFTALTARYNGLSAVKSIFRAMSNLGPANKANRVTLNRIGLLGEYSINKARTANRLSEVWGYGKSARFADMSIRASGLNYWTTATREAFQLEFMSNISNLVDTPWAKLNKRLRASMERYGINDADWLDIKYSTKYKKRGVSFVDLGSESIPIGTREKFVAMIKEETMFAVPEPSAKTKAILHQGTQRGTVLGELIRTMTQFKAFPVSILTSHFHRGVNLKGASRLAYLGSLMAGTTAVGMAVVQVKDLLKGKDIRDINSELVYQGMLQGGSRGVF